MNRHAHSGLTIALWLATVTSAGGQTLYVDDDAPAGGDGRRWDTAFRYVQDALYLAGEDPSIDEIRVAQGVYRPDRGEAGPVTPGDRDATFRLLNGVALLGGYAGRGAPDPDERDIDAHPTILSGDLSESDIEDLAGGLRCFSGDGHAYPDGCESFDTDGDGDVDCVDLGTCENSYSVVTASDVVETTVLEGVVLTAGFANGVYTEPQTRRYGAGIYNERGTPAVSRCTFSSNLAAGGSAMATWSGGDVTITACRIVDNHGSAIRNEEASVSIVDTAFEGGVDGFMYALSSDSSLVGCTILDNSGPQVAGDYGFGAVTIYNGSATITDCTFRGNLGGYGGAVRAAEAHLTVSNSTFEDNAATDPTHLAYGGGAIYGYRSDVLVTDCTFDRNRAATYGGAIAIYDCSTSLTRCGFHGNQADIGGAVLATVYDPDVANTAVTDCSFTENTASRGGGMVVDAPATIADCTFSGNSALAEWFDGGGAMYTIDDVTVTRCTFTANSAGPGRGGAVRSGTSYGEDAGPTVSDCTFTGNFAAVGGGMYHNGGDPAILSCVFVENSVDGALGSNGGGLSIESGRPTVTGCTFVNNTAGLSPDRAASGGGLAIYESSSFVTRCAFEGNSSTYSGGGMGVEGGDSSISECTFNRNIAHVRGGGLDYADTGNVAVCTFTGNRAPFGGGIYGDSDSARIRHSTVIGNRADAFHPLDGRGGGVYLSGTLTLTSCCVIANSSSGAGGGVFCQGPASMVRDTIAWGNTDASGTGEAAQIDWTEPAPEVIYTCVQGLDTLEGEGDIDADPLLAREPNDGGDGWGDDPDTPDDEGANDDYGDVHLRPASPCIDAGNPARNYDLEPEPNGNRINMGAYGNTLEATPAAWFWDFNNDGVVNLDDYVLWAACFTGPGIEASEDCTPTDTNGDDAVDLLDYQGFQRAFGASREK